MGKNYLLKPTGFTIVELLVSITIIALLSTIGLTGYQSVSRGGRDALRKSDLEQIRSALEIYKSEKNYYPASSSECLPDELEPDFLNPMPSDPKSPALQYCYVQLSNLTYELCAHLENAEDTDIGCGGLCNGTCNYRVVNP